MPQIPSAEFSDGGEREMKDCKNSKVITLQKATEQIREGDIVYTSGILGRKPVAFEYELIRQKKKNLILLNVLIYGEDLMIGAGCVSGYYGCYVGMGPFGLCQNFGRELKDGNLVSVEAGHLEMVFGLAAGAMGVPFIPSRASVGTDILNPAYCHMDKLRNLARNKDKLPINRLQSLEDPFGGGKFSLMPAIRPDVAVVHAQQAGPEGTVRIIGPLASDVDAVRAADKVIVTCEQIVPEEYLRRDPHFNTFASNEIDYVVEAPWGSHPGSVYGHYDVDPKFLRAYQSASRTKEGTQKWLDDWVFNIHDQYEYWEKLGMRRLDGIKVKNPVLGYKPWKEWEDYLL
jgi:glutaconate CoA-transferase, subunit A